jgi:hypothetical protein
MCRHKALKNSAAGQKEPFSTTSLVCLMLAASMLTGLGCGKHKKSEPVNPSVATNLPANNYFPVQGQPPTVQSAPTVRANGEPDLAELNRSLLRWMMRNHRRPQTFEDFAATAGVTIPPAPPGKKYVIASDMHIKLVSQ